MEIVYSASNNSFFAKNDVAKYEQAGWELADIVEVTYDTYLEFIEDRTLQGKVRIAGDDGHPAWGICLHRHTTNLLLPLNKFASNCWHMRTKLCSTGEQN